MSKGSTTPTTRRVAGAACAATAAMAAVMIPAATSSAESPLCAAHVLEPSTRERPSDSPGQGKLEVILTSTATHACAVQGFLGVDLVGPEDPTFGPIYQLPRQEGEPTRLTVQPGGAVSSLITYLPGGQDGWVPDTIVVTPENTFAQVETPWPAGVSVQRQDGATHPGTYIGPLLPAS